MFSVEARLDQGICKICRSFNHKQVYILKLIKHSAFEHCVIANL